MNVDTEATVNDVERLLRSAGELGDFFDTSREIVIARAPGRLDLMGGIADYSGSLVLQWPIREATMAAVQTAHDGMLAIVSRSTSEAERRFEMPLKDFDGASGPVDYAAAASYFARDPNRRWAAYAAGAVLVLMREDGVALPSGLRVLLDSNVPEGKGVSSSAAIEVASMTAIGGAMGVEIEPRRLAILCRTVENRVAGAPCGVMDQMTSAYGRQGKLLALLCQPAEVEGFADLPDELEIWGIDSGIRHAVSGADYGTVRTASIMGRHIIESELGVDVVPGGYLANVAANSSVMRRATRLPMTLTGTEFHTRYGDAIGAEARMEADVEYPVLAATIHPIVENSQVRSFRRILEAYASGDWESIAFPNVPAESTKSAALVHLGGLMSSSHLSYTRCGLGSAGTDSLVAIARKLGSNRGIYGAKITGGGSGGTVAVLARRGSEEAVREIASTYADETGHQPYVFTGTSMGAAEFGTIKARAVDGRWRVV